MSSQITINALAAYLEAHVGRRDLAIDDCQLAASQFMQMCQASLFLPFIFQAAHRLRPSASRRWSKARRRCSSRRIGRSRIDCGSGVGISSQAMTVSSRRTPGSIRRGPSFRRPCSRITSREYLWLWVPAFAGTTMSGHTLAFSRRITPELLQRNLRPTKGVGNAGCSMHP